MEDSCAMTGSIESMQHKYQISLLSFLFSTIYFVNTTMIANILFATKGDVDDILCDTMDSLDVICANLGHPIPSLYRLDTNCRTYISIFFC